MAKVLNILIGVIGILYICGQVVYYGFVRLLSTMGYIHAETTADSHKIILDWVIFMAFLLLIFSCVALIANFIKFQEAHFGLRLIFNIVCIFMPFLHIKNHLTIAFEGIFLILFVLYLATTKRSKSIDKNNNRIDYNDRG